MFRVLFTLFIFSFLGYDRICRGEDVQISFKNLLPPFKEKDVVIELVPQAEIKIIFSSIPFDVDFLLIQTHSYKYSTILSSNSVLTPDNHVNGTNIGLFLHNQIGTTTVYLKNPVGFNVTCLVVAIPYTAESPVPGGCNIQAPIPIKTFLSLQMTSATITVDASPASNSDDDKNCDFSSFTYVLFYKYLPKRDFSMGTYFDAIRSMLTYPDILNSSQMRVDQIDGPPLRKIFSKYSGTGTVYSLAVFNSYGNVAVYTPSLSYACDDSEQETCDIMSTPSLKIGFALFLTISAFICFAGHRYFLSELFFMGAITGGLISYALLLCQTSYSGDLELTALGIGLVFGAIWVSVWWCVNRPIISVGLSYYINGFLITAALFFFLLSGFKIFQNDFNYWFTFLVIMNMIFLISTLNAVQYNMLACSIVGGYGVLYPLDYYIGSNLKYILINVIRRITVEDFNQAITSPPLQVADWNLCVFWVVLIVVGYVSQKKLSVGRPPFPPICSVLRGEAPETTPILTNARIPMYT